MKKLYFIEEITDENHNDYYNKIIFFQFNYNIPIVLNDPDTGYYYQANTSYASLDYGVLYLSCEPIVYGDIRLKTPICYYQKIKEIKIPFDRDLEEEELKYMSLYSETTLFPNENYQIKYWAFKNNKPRVSGISNFFSYDTLPPLPFKIKADNPICYKAKVDITIETGRGKPPHFYNDLNEETEMLTKIKRFRLIHQT
ncbi:hypothetical protein [Flavobacterium gyeonganense]|uniref:Uncharacterized protein n=1 Tax=Flavobacterium gyeonganense TaxID=1310418 RepID=A0ABV5HH80_9FLAO|nr:hypothetical protein [Flavobacterium gyeonganense]